MYSIKHILNASYDPVEEKLMANGGSGGGTSLYSIKYIFNQIFDPAGFLKIIDAGASLPDPFPQTRIQHNLDYQLRLLYDPLNYTDMFTNGSGILIFNPTGNIVEFQSNVDVYGVLNVAYDGILFSHIYTDANGNLFVKPDSANANIAIGGATGGTDSIQSQYMSYRAGYNNTGDYCFLSGTYSGFNNIGTSAIGAGTRTLFWNTGNYCVASGHYAMFQNCGNNVTGAGLRAAQYNQADYVTAIGDLCHAFFLDDTANEKTFDNTNIDPGTDRITITAHGFGATDDYINLRFIEGTSSINGLTDNDVYQVKIVGPDTIGFRENDGPFGGLRGTDIKNTGTGTGHKLVPQYSYPNIIVIGTRAKPDESNCVHVNGPNINKLKVGTTEQPADLEIPSGKIQIETTDIEDIGSVLTINNPFKIQSTLDQLHLEYDASHYMAMKVFDTGKFVMNQSVLGRSIGIGTSSNWNATGTDVYSIGYLSGLNCTGNNVTNKGNNAGSNCTGSDTDNSGNNAGRYSAGNYCINNGRYAGSENAGNYAINLQYFSGRFNIGDYVFNSGYYTGQFNTGDRITAIQERAARYNNGSQCVFIGDYNGQYNDSDNVSAIGYNCNSSFLENTSGNKTFDNTDIDIPNSRITIASHGFGSTGEYKNLKYTEGTSPITGLVNGQIYQFKIVDGNTIGSYETDGPGGLNRGFQITDAGTGTGHTFTPQQQWGNMTCIGNNHVPDEGNSIHLNGNGQTKIKFGSSSNPADTVYNSTITSKRYDETLADEAYINLPASSFGWGKVIIGDSGESASEWANFNFKTDGTVTLENNSANVITSNTDNYLCIYNTGGTVRVLNRLGYSLSLLCKITYK